MASEFHKLSIQNDLIQALHTYGIDEPTPIQEQSIPILLAGNDLIGQAQTGTGKTLAFVLPILEKIDVTKGEVQALIVTPTRELAIQITEELEKLAPHVGAAILPVYGGQDVERQIRKLQRQVHIVVGTPGRLLDHLRRGTVDLSGLSFFVLDEADLMLDMGFLADVEQIIRQIPEKRQTALFSATMPKQIRSLAEQYMRSPQEVRVQAKKVTVDEIQQIVVETTDRQKQDALCRMIDEYNPFLAIIFCRTKRRASTLNEALLQKGYLSDELHGDLSQSKREQVMKRFRDAQLQILVATDVAARGLDVEGVTHVFNYDIPHDVESYIHRIGRTARAGQTGVAVTFVAPRDRDFLRMIEKGIDTALERRSADGSPLKERSSRRSDAGNRNKSNSKMRNGRPTRRNAGAVDKRSPQERTDKRNSQERTDKRNSQERTAIGKDRQAKPAEKRSPKQTIGKSNVNKSFDGRHQTTGSKHQTKRNSSRNRPR